MPLAELTRWHDLRCACGGAQFEKLYALKRHANGGMSEEASGWKCSRCQQPTDTGTLWNHLRRQQIKEQMAAMQMELVTELGESSPSSPASSSVSNG